jgi:hypothetical protein
MVRLSILLDTLKCNTRREIGFDGTRNNIHRGPLRCNDQVYTDGPRQLRQPGDWHFHFFAGGHDQVGELIHN